MIKEQWNRLAIELGFELKQEIRPLVELPSLHKMAAHAVKKGDMQRAGKLLEHPMIKDLLSKTFVGSATGEYHGFEFAIFPCAVDLSTPTPRYFVNFVLLFKQERPFGLEIFHNGLISKMGKALMPGSYIKIPDNVILNKAIAVKAKSKNQVRGLLSDKALQDKLVKLYKFSKRFSISDRAIRFDRPGTIISKDEALKIMDLMVDVAERLKT